MEQKQFIVSVICSDATTFTQRIIVDNRKQANIFLDGVVSLYKQQGKEIYFSSVKRSNQ